MQIWYYIHILRHEQAWFHHPHEGAHWETFIAIHGITKLKNAPNVIISTHTKPLIPKLSVCFQFESPFYDLWPVHVIMRHLKLKLAHLLKVKKYLTSSVFLAINVFHCLTSHCQEQKLRCVCKLTINVAVISEFLL